MYNLNNITPEDAAEIGDVLRTPGAGASSMEEVADRTVRYLCSNLGDDTSGRRSCVLTRFFKTEPYGNLPSHLQDFTRDALGTSSVPQDTSCLTLLATVGDKADWNSRARSSRYKVIPLSDEKAVAEIPMMFQLIHQFGIEVSEVVHPDPSLIVDLEQKTYNTFYVSEAIGSPYIPAQEEFVIPYGIRSVLGFGGILMSGAFFAIVLFSKTPIPRETAESFKTLAPNIKQAVLPFVGGAIFERSSNPAP